MKSNEALDSRKILIYLLATSYNFTKLQLGCCVQCIILSRKTYKFFNLFYKNQCPKRSFNFNQNFWGVQNDLRIVFINPTSS